MKLLRFTAAGSITLTGLVLLVPNAAQLFASPPLVGFVLAALASIISLGLVAVGPLVYRADIDDVNTARVAGWNLLGLAVLGFVFTLVFTYQPVDNTPFIFAAVLSAGAVAHVIIGVYDVRRIRAEELATEREKLAVLNTLVRHNLRHDAQLLLAAASVVDTDSIPGEHVRTVADDLAEMNENVKTIEQSLEEHPHEIDVAAVCREAVVDARDEYADREFVLDAPDSLTATANDHFRAAVDELVENAVEHGAGTVTVHATDAGGSVEVSVSDDGDGIPAKERELVLGERPITQLEHGSGLGLWLVRWTVEGVGGSLAFDDAGSRAVVTLPA
ncbi:sensor histidine kinase [Halocalculus aciditolerans]|uniref:histidine kinase n=1 Tax=Halocalculus aciditolerans TaxID=1383812 RepID=A0A830F200_9EURY|nr:sensor histidine kinase [Halocalculus aciditolerans]GGL54218.1 hypothetical protein GCM10009039_10480 [Halocalculus aciditolerans]